MKTIIIETTNIDEERVWIVSKSADWKNNKDNKVFKKKAEAEAYRESQLND